MDPGSWYTLLSYVFEMPVEKRQSRFSGEVTVSFHRGQYKLSVQHAIYSFGKHYTSFSIPFNSLHIYAQELPSVLVIGFGLGSVVDLLEKNQSIKKITAVDSDAVILELAAKYLRSGLKDKVTYICEDAQAFLQNNREQFDLVLFDVFIDEKTPVPFMQGSFLMALKNAMAKHGLLLFSKIDTSFADSIENTQFEKTFSGVFPEAFSMEADGNKIFCARN